VPEHSYIDEVSTSKRILANGRVRTESDLEILHSSCFKSEGKVQLKVVMTCKTF